jgi:hypothetical protein
MFFAYVPNEAFAEWPQSLPQDGKQMGASKTIFDALRVIVADESAAAPPAHIKIVG